MNNHHKSADRLIREVIKGLEFILGQDGEDITYFGNVALKECIDFLTEARIHMVKAEAQNEKKT